MAAIFKIWNTLISGATDGQIDLGSDSLRFNDLHLSGTAYLIDVLMSGNIDMNDYSLENIGYLYGADSSDYIRMGVTNRIIINATGAGSPFSTPDIDVTGSSYFDDDMGLPLDKKLYFGDTGVYIFSDDDGYFDIVADTGVRITGDLDCIGDLNLTSSGEINLIFYDGDLVSYEGNAVFN